MIYGFQNYKPSQILRGHLAMGGVSPTGETLAVNSLYFERNGKPFIGVMGEYHFVRDRRDHWYTELCKMKAGGISTVATYLFWIYHEEIEGEFDFTGDRDIRFFVQESQRAGLDVVIRIGPWAHGECRNGGFPDWLLQKPFALRDNNPGYMAKARIWYEHVYEQVKGLFFKDGGPIIGVQIENELIDKPDHMLALKRLAVDVGFDAPFYTATGWNHLYGAKLPVDEFLPVFAAYVEAPWEQHIEKLPLSQHYVFSEVRNDAAVGKDLIGKTDTEGWRLPYERYPFATCELGAGLPFSHHRRAVIHGMDAYALSLVKLGSGNNLIGYYMYHGGTNKLGKRSTLQESRATGYPNDYPILNYDFHTCLTQYGETREQYGLLNLLHLFAADFGELLAPMEYVKAAQPSAAEDLRSLRYALRTDGRAGFVFINHYQRLAQLEDLHGVVIDTGTVTFPPIDVVGETSFFMPFHLNLSGQLLIYATAQPLCKCGDTVFFAAIEGIKPRYCFAGAKECAVTPGLGSGFVYENVRIVTLPWNLAQRLRKLNGRVYVGENCDLYMEDGQLRSVQEGEFTYYDWNGEAFERKTAGAVIHQTALTVEDASEPYVPPYAEELNLGGERRRTWKKLTVSSAEGFAEISDPCDVAQIYADGVMVADNFYCGEPWRVPASLLYGKECYLVMSELKDDFYREF